MTTNLARWPCTAGLQSGLIHYISDDKVVWSLSQLPSTDKISIMLGVSITDCVVTRCLFVRHALMLSKMDKHMIKILSEIHAST